MIAVSFAPCCLCYTHLAPGLVRVLIPLLLVTIDSGRAQRLLRQRLAAPVALVPALRLPLVLVTPVEFPFTYNGGNNNNNGYTYMINITNKSIHSSITVFIHPKSQYIVRICLSV